MPNYPWPKTHQEIMDETTKVGFSKVLHKLQKSNQSGEFTKAEIYTAFLDGITVGLNLAKDIYSE